MKFKRVALFLVVGVMVLAAVTAVVPHIAQAQGPNLLQNPGFEGGHYNQDGIAEITVPNGWRMHWSNGESQIFGGYATTARPETVVWNISGAPANEKDLFWKDGIYTVKIFKGWAPLWAAMSQDVTGLEVGRRYRLVAPIFIDIVADYDENGKVAPVDGRQGRVRLGAGPTGAAWRDEAAIAYSPWYTGENVSPFYLAYPTFTYDFTATQPNMTVWIEMASNYPHPNNGFFIDTVGLYALDAVDNSAAASAPAAPAEGGNAVAAAQPAGPTATPLPTPTPRADGAVVHVVQSGDSWWSLAITYAATMGLSPEEALTRIPELNGNPSVITSGDELIIIPPSESAEAAAPQDAEAVAEADTEVTPEATAEAEADTEAAAEDTVATEESAATEEAGAAEEASSDESRAQQALPNIQGASVCVQAYMDSNGDGVRQQGETSLADSAVTLSRAGNTVSTYITTGSEDGYCFEQLEPDTYQVQIFPPADYAVTTEDSWAVAVAEGVMVPVSFGLQEATAVVSADTPAADAPADEAPAAAPPAEEAAQSNGLMSNVGFIVLGVAVVLVLLAGAGIYLLRRG